MLKHFANFIGIIKYCKFKILAIIALDSASLGNPHSIYPCIFYNARNKGEKITGCYRRFGYNLWEEKG